MASMNPNIIKVQYAVRGEVPIKAGEFEERLAKGDKSLPFDSIVWANIGNPQQQPNLAQPPLTFWRQVAALTELPSLLDAKACDSLFPKDTQERARELLSSFGSVGAYTGSKGSPLVRQHVCDFIQERDGGHPVNVEDIYLTAGASEGVSLLFQAFFYGGDQGVLIPIPQYPLYSATLTSLGVQALPYFLDEQRLWDPNREHVEERVRDARARGVQPRALVVINPGNPTGACMTKQEIEDMIRLAYRERLIIFADEVYQSNVYYRDHPFYSFHKVLRDFANSSDPAECEMSHTVELISLHSISKGVSGECGRRGGYFHLTNVDPEVEAQVNKLSSVHLCPPAQGQIGVDMLVRPPKPGDPSHELWEKETQQIFNTLKSRSETMAKEFSKLPGVEIAAARGAMYLFPRVNVPSAAWDAAQRRGKNVDELYALELLERSGICVVPGSGFGLMPEQHADGSGHLYFRTTILAKQTDQFIQRYGVFHRDFLERYS